jgi:hypothetical protein
MAEIDYLTIALITSFSASFGGFFGAIGAELAKYLLNKARSNKLLKTETNNKDGLGIGWKTVFFVKHLFSVHP